MIKIKMTLSLITSNVISHRQRLQEEDYTQSYNIFLDYFTQLYVHIKTK